MLTPNTVLQDRYRIVRELGQGGMGTVYEAVDQRLSSIVAIKETLLTTDEARRSFQSEASLLANLLQPSLPNVIDHFAEGDEQYLVMEFIGGENLAELLELRQHAFSAKDVLQWGDVLLKALEYLHSHNPPILHRDIKPSNLKLTREGELFLIDFGLAKGTAGQMPTLLTSRSIKGYTPVYSPLEQIHGVGTDPRSDLYSLGATLYHLITGVAPVDAPTRFAALDDDQPDPLRPADEVNAEVPHAVAEALAKAMAMNRKNRPANATEMRRLLQAASQSLTESKSATSAAVIRTGAPAIIRPTEPSPGAAPRNVAIPPTEPPPAVAGPKVLRAPAPARHVPTMDEIPALIQRPQPATAGSVLFSAPPNASRPLPAPRKLGMAAKLGIAAIIAVVLLFFGAVTLAPALIARFKKTSNLVTNNDSNPGSQVVAKTEPTPPPKPAISGDFEAGKALELIYGSFDYKRKYAKWKLGNDEMNKFGISREVDFKGQTVYTSMLSVQSYLQNGVEKFLLITQTKPAQYDCHACAPFVGGASFSKKDNGWQLDAEARYIERMGGFGHAPEGKLIKIGPDRQGVVFHVGDMGQGIVSEGVVMIADIDGTIREIVNIDDFSGDNSASGCGEGGGDSGGAVSSMPCYGYSSKMQFKPGASPDYYDLIVSTTGTKQNEDFTVRRVNETKKYVFAQGKYALAK